MEIGDKVVLWKVRYTSNAYKDPFTKIYQFGYIVEKEYIVTVKETKIIYGMWDKHCRYIGYRATIDENLDEFYLNWESFPDDSSTPTFYWYQKGIKFSELVDACQAYNLGGTAYVTLDGKVAIPSTPAQICPMHDRAFIPNNNKCFDCFTEIMRYRDTLMGKFWGCDMENK